MASTSLVLFALMASSLVAVIDGWCTDSSDCQPSGQSNQVCCNNQCVYGSSCAGRSCTLTSDCSSGETCCNYQCEVSSDCIGYSCSIDSDCGNWGSCCFGTCQNTWDDCYDGTAVIVGSIFGALLVMFLIAICIFLALRRRRARHGRVIVGGRVPATAITTTTRTATQTNPLYPGQAPQFYQQGYPYYPPPQYEQQQTAIPPPYSLAGTATPPPPYTGAPQDRSGGGVYTPKPSYGAVPSAPPV